MPIHSTFNPIQPDDLQIYVPRFARTSTYQQAHAFLLDSQSARIKSLPEIEPLIRCYA